MNERNEGKESEDFTEFNNHKKQIESKDKSKRLFALSIYILVTLIFIGLINYILAEYVFSNEIINFLKKLFSKNN